MSIFWKIWRVPSIGQAPPQLPANIYTGNCQKLMTQTYSFFRHRPIFTGPPVSIFPFFFTWRGICRSSPDAPDAPQCPAGASPEKKHPLGIHWASAGHPQTPRDAPPRSPIDALPVPRGEKGRSFSYISEEFAEVGRFTNMRNVCEKTHWTLLESHWSQPFAQLKKLWI